MSVHIAFRASLSDTATHLSHCTVSTLLSLIRISGEIGEIEHSWDPEVVNPEYHD